MQLAALALAALASAGASPPSPPDTPLGAFPDYSHPEVTVDNCQSKGPGRTECFIPAKTAGRYFVEAEGTATATGANATQTLVIRGPSWACSRPVTTKKGEWTSGKRTFQIGCVVTVLTDTALPVIAAFSATDATLDPGGPVIHIRRIGWNGVLEVNDFQYGIKPSPAKESK